MVVVGERVICNADSFESYLLWKRYKSLDVFIHVFVRGREKYSVILNNKNILKQIFRNVKVLEIETLVV